LETELRGTVRQKGWSVAELIATLQLSTDSLIRVRSCEG